MNYYEILEVSVNASKEVIKNAYRALSKKYHPDSYVGDTKYAEQKMKEINTAYATLIDEAKRLKYDYDNGFKIDSNSILEDTDNIIETKDNNYNEEPKKDDLKNNDNKKIIILVSIVSIAIIALFFIAFLVGVLLAEDNDGEKKQIDTENSSEEKPKYNINDSYTTDNSNDNNDNFNDSYVENNSIENNEPDKNEEKDDKIDEEQNDSDEEMNTEPNPSQGVS